MHKPATPEPSIEMIGLGAPRPTGVRVIGTSHPASAGAAIPADPTRGPCRARRMRARWRARRDATRQRTSPPAPVHVGAGSEMTDERLAGIRGGEVALQLDVFPAHDVSSPHSRHARSSDPSWSTVSSIRPPQRHFSRHPSRNVTLTPSPCAARPRLARASTGPACGARSRRRLAGRRRRTPRKVLGSPR